MAERMTDLKVVPDAYDPTKDGWREAYHRLTEPDTPIEWIVDRIIAPGTLNLITGGPKSYKTWWLHQVGIVCACGGKLHGQFQTRESRVLFVQAEESHRQHRRKIQWSTSGLEIGAEQAANMAILDWVGPMKLTDPKDREFFLRAFEFWLPNLVIVDSFRRTHEGDERERGSAQRLKDGVDEYLRLFPGCAWLVNHHHRKLSGDSGRDSPRELVAGTGDLIAVADGHVAFHRDRKTNTITATHDACRDDEELKPWLMRFHAREGKAWFEWLGWAEVGAMDTSAMIVLANLKTVGGWVRTPDLGERLEKLGDALPKRKLKACLDELVDAGLVMKRPSGQHGDRAHEWRAADEEERAG